MRMALHDCLDRLGFPVFMLPDASQANPILRASIKSNYSEASLAKMQAPSPWRLSDCSLAVVDLNGYGRESAELERAIEQVGELPTLYLDDPLPKEAQQQDHWRRSLVRKLVILEAEVTLGPANPDQPIWLLIGSTGCPEAVRTFIDSLPLHLPVGFLYGQHINSGFEKNLVTMLDGRRGFQASLAKSGQRLSAGNIVIAHPTQHMSLLDNDVLLVEPEPWPGQFQPSLESLVVDFSHRKLSAGGIIVFSGMGGDGSAAMRLYASRGGRVWVQSPDTCVVSSMPEAVLASSKVELTATPEALASHLAALYPC